MQYNFNIKAFLNKHEAILAVFDVCEPMQFLHVNTERSIYAICGQGNWLRDDQRDTMHNTLRYTKTM